MVQRFILAFLFCISLCTAGAAAEDTSKPDEMSLAELEEYQLELQSELNSLAKKNLSRNIGSLGYCSLYSKVARGREWVEIDLGKAIDINEIILIPTIRRDPLKGSVSDGFPEAFEIQAYQSDDDSFEVIAKYSMTHSDSPNIYPIIIPIRGVKASRIRVVATQLGESQLWSADSTKSFQLAEIMIFNGEENVALHCPVSASSPVDDDINWSKNFLVDGNLPYLMDSAYGELSLSMARLINKNHRESITIDLGQETLVSRLRIHTEDKSNTVPQIHIDYNGLPTRFILEGSSDADFLDSQLLLEVSIKSSTEIGPIMEWAFEEKSCRYIRLTAMDDIDGLELFTDHPNKKRIGFSEIEILSRGKNVSLGKKVTATFQVNHPKANLVNLTDGRNIYGNILPIRQWLGELSRRHTLETELPLIEAEITIRYAKQKRLLAWAVGLASLLILGVGLLAINGRRSLKIQEAQIRGRIAANLHDELGANLHAIGLLGDLAKEAVNDPDDLIDTVERIRGLTKRTGKSAYRCANMLESKGFCDDLIADIKEESRALLGDIQYTFICEEEAAWNTLKRRTRIDLLLFYKECLANIIRHSGATCVEVKLTVEKKGILMRITDNGKGLDGHLPKSLARRARLLGATFHAESFDSRQGAVITLALKSRKWKLLR